MHMDEFVDELLTQERVCELILPRMTKREVLEETEGLAPRLSKLEDVLLNGKGALNGGQNNGNGQRRRHGSDDDEEMDMGEESDDSLSAERNQRQRRIERAAQIRAKREAEEEARAIRALGGTTFVTHTGNGAAGAEPGVNGDNADAEYVSQEETSDEEGEGGRYVSRSPSRSVSPDRQGGDKSEDEGYRSRSPSRSPDREKSPGYRSRSGSRSPDR
jgi:pre-mRNA-splicing factor 38A